ncbi:hypothetical protein DFH08DRAFT_827671 [Mycena albidolilacea]|uniref:Uncharacterized protein n=1 Tax=Mycena albidolilacea TaxID=1033008 RepID=A0AAD6YXN8_9AGAR|nr:hypothetical protein DFH08DRAFT_827671 [Mycena albidolilacea]
MAQDLEEDQEEEDWEQAAAAAACIFLGAEEARRIKWPESVEEFQALNDLIVERHPRLTGVFASIDGLNLPAQTADDEEMENTTYNGWLCEHFISSVFVFSPQDQIQGKIRAPIKTGQRIRGTSVQIEERLAFDRELLSYRQTAEWGMRTLQGSFGRLRLPLSVNNQDARGDLLEICARLHNLRAKRVGHNQIRSVYMPIWRQNKEDEEVWTNFENMLFSDQRRVDRVSRFHNFPEYE